MRERSVERIDLSNDLETVTGELVVPAGAEMEAASASVPAVNDLNPSPASSAVYSYLLLPFLFLTVALLGGLRINSADSSFIFLKPALIYLIFSVVLMLLFVRARLIVIEGWFAEDMPVLRNIANGAVFVSLFAATAQLFNSLTPERGLPFWIISFCFFWTLWNNLFAEFDTKRLLKSLGGLFGIAFFTKYLLLANLAAPEGGSWLNRIIENPAQEAFTWLLDIPRFSPATGYIQFFTVLIYLFGLYLLPTSMRSKQ